MPKNQTEMTEAELRGHIGRPVTEILGHTCHTFYPLVNSEGTIIDVVSIDADMEGLELVEDTYLIIENAED